jgi:hypothetical protein
MDTKKYPILLFSMACGLWLVFGLLWLIVVPSQAVQANPGELFVSQSGGGTTCTQAVPCTLQTALGQAVDGDVIYMGAGIYTGVGDAVVSLDKSVQLLGGWDGAVSGTVVRDPASHPTILDGEGQRRVIFISGKVTPTVNGFTIRRGNATNASVEAGKGGGIYNDMAAPVIANNVITANLAFSNTDWGYGGGIYMNSLFAPAMITNCVFANNVSNAAPEGPGLGGGFM